MRVEHPRAGDGPGEPPAAVDVNGTHAPVDDDGTFAVPDDAQAWLQRFAEGHGVTPDDLLDSDDGEITIDEVEALADEVIEDRIDAGDCPWCGEYEGDHVGQHASSAHPDAWDDYTED